jgi:hypothetical protein
MIKKLALAVALCGATPAFAVVSPFGGAATGNDPLGHSWIAQDQHWGEPGYGAGYLTFNSGALTGSGAETYATSFAFTFLKGVSGVLDTNFSLDPFNFVSETRFINVTDGVAWLVAFEGNKVTFTAPDMASKLDVGDTFFVNVKFTGDVDTSKFSFAGLWDEESVQAVPEPTTWAMMIGGLSLVGLQMRRRKTTVSFA